MDPYKVKRFAPSRRLPAKGELDGVVISDHGEYVKFSDYETLRKLLEEERLATFVNAHAGL